MNVTALSDLFRVVITGQAHVVCSADPTNAGWKYLTFAAVDLPAGSTIEIDTADQEIAVVPLDAHVEVEVNGRTELLSRNDVFRDPGSVFYCPPATRCRIKALTDSSITIGGAPAVPGYAARTFQPDVIRVELRGGGAARRQVSHLLAPPIEAHRLILYEVLVPRGSWSGWPPHCHDGKDGSPYLEETYYFQHRPSNGFGVHRNFRESDGLDDITIAFDRSLVIVPAGYHTTAASPGSHMYFLNYLAGDLEHHARATPPCFDERYVWIDGHWDDDPLHLPTATS